MRKLKKGFTIVELVIVIAVVAVLTAVLVPTFIHLTKKARDASDKSVVKNANTQLAAKEGVEGKNKSMSDAVKDVDEIGYHIPGVSTGNDNQIVWDSVSDRFVLLDKNGNVLLKDSETVAAHNKLFLAVSSLSERGDFAVYAKSNYNDVTSFTTPISFDAGDKEGIETISYDFDDDPAEILVATNSQDTVLTVDCPYAEFEHVGLVGKEIITRVKGSTFVEYGKVGFVQIDQGHYVADEGADVKAVYLTTDAAKVDRENGGIIVNAYGATADVKNENHNVELVVNGDKNAVEEAAMDALDEDINPQPPVAGTPINNEDELRAALLGSGGEYYLAQPVTLTQGLDSTSNVTIDLNGKTLNVEAPAYNYETGCVISAKDSGAVLRFKDSSNGSGGIYNTSPTYNDAILGVIQGGTIIVESGIYLSTEQPLFGGMFGTITINGGSIYGYFGAGFMNTLNINVPCSIHYYEEMGSIRFNEAYNLVLGTGITRVSGNPSAYIETTLVFTQI